MRLQYDTKDQGAIASAAAGLSLEVEKEMPRVPWLSNSGQQEAFRKIVELSASKVAALDGDDAAKKAALFWVLTLLYANSKSFRLATARVKNWSAYGIQPVAASFVAWVGEETHPGVAINKAMSGWLPQSARTELRSPESALASQLRLTSTVAYEAGFQIARATGKGGETAWHQAALIFVLVERLQRSQGGAPVDEHGRVACQVEMLPFAQMPSAEGKLALIKYVVWREYPAQADEAKVAAAIAKASKVMGDDFAQYRDLAQKIPVSVGTIAGLVDRPQTAATATLSATVLE